MWSMFLEFICQLWKFHWSYTKDNVIVFEKKNVLYKSPNTSHVERESMQLTSHSQACRRDTELQTRIR